MNTLHRCALIAFAFAACAEEDAPSGLGQVELALSVADAGSGSWRLADAELTIKRASGGEPVRTLTDDGTHAVLRTKLAAGDYVVELGGPWHIDRVVGATTFPINDAVLVDTAPLPFSIADGEATLVTFHFKRVKQGTLGIGMSIEGVLPTVTAVVAFDSVDEDSPLLGALVGKQAALTVAFQSATVSQSSKDGITDTSITDTSIISPDHAVQWSEGAPALLVDLFAGAPSADGAPTLNLSSDGTATISADAQGAGQSTCALILEGDMTAAPTLDGKGFPAFVPFEVDTGSVTIQCNEMGIHSVHGTGTFVVD